MKKLLVAIAAVAGLAYGAYRYFGMPADQRKAELDKAKALVGQVPQQGQTLLDQVKDKAKEIEKEAQRRAAEAAKAPPSGK